MRQRTLPWGGSATAGIVTAASMVVTSAAAAAVGVLIARYFGRNARTDGFFAAYGVYLVLNLAAASVRVVVLPGLARGRAAAALVGETGGYAVAFGVAALPVLALTMAFPEWLAHELTASAEARAVAREALPWLGAAAVAQLYAGLAASALAALDSYAVAAVGFALGGIGGLATLIALVGEGIIAVSYGLAVNGVLSLSIPVVALAWRARGRALQRPAPRLTQRLVVLAEGIIYPLALQALILVALRSASQIGVGSATSFSYAYLIASSLVVIVATSLALVLTVPLTRRGVEPASAHYHVVHVTWLCVVPIAAVAGTLALAGEPLLRSLLGPEFAGDVGSQLGRLVVYLAPWMVVSVAVTVTVPLMFVLRRTRLLPVLGVLALVLHFAVDRIGRELFGLPGIALALAVTTGLALAAQLAMLSRHALAGAIRGVARAAFVVAALGASSFILVSLVTDEIVAAALGTAAYAAVLVVLRPSGLRAAWDYLVTLR